MLSIEELTAKVLTYCIEKKTTIRDSIYKLIKYENIRPIIKALSINIAKRYLTIDAICREFLNIKLERLDNYRKNLLRVLVYEILYRNYSVDKLYRFLRKFKLCIRDIALLSKNFDINELLHGKDFIEKLSVKYSTPRWIIERFMMYVEDSIEDLLKFLMEKPVKYVRVCTHLVSVYEVVRRLNEKGISCSVDPDFDDLIVIHSDVNVTKLKEYRDGLIYPQDKASLAISKLLLEECRKYKTIFIDLTAGPGNKMSYISQYGFYTIGFEISRRRILEIKRNVERIRLYNVDYVHTDSTYLPIKLRDSTKLFLIDPDCSSLGRLQHNPEIKMWLTPIDVLNKSRLQRNLLRNVLSKVLRGSTVYYCTCTLTYEENEYNVISMLNLDNVDIDYTGILKLGISSPILRKCVIILPHIHRCSGFFISKIVKY